MKLTKVQPTFKKVIPMFSIWKLLDGKDIPQNVYLSAICKDFCLSPSHLEHMCRSCPHMRTEIVSRLLPCVAGGEAAQTLSMLLFPTIFEFLRMHKAMRCFLDFNI